MQTAGATSTPTGAAPQSQAGVRCGMCDHYHKLGSACSYTKGILSLFDMVKADQPTMAGKIPGIKRAKVPEVSVPEVPTGGGGGIPGHTGGNPYHGKDGKFASKDQAATATPAKGKPAVPLKSSAPIEAASDTLVTAKPKKGKKENTYFKDRKAKKKELEANNSPYLRNDKAEKNRGLGEGSSVPNPKYDPSKPTGPAPVDGSATAASPRPEMPKPVKQAKAKQAKGATTVADGGAGVLDNLGIAPAKMPDGGVAAGKDPKKSPGVRNDVGTAKTAPATPVPSTVSVGTAKTEMATPPAVSSKPFDPNSTAAASKKKANAKGAEVAGSDAGSGKVEGKEQEQEFDPDGLIRNQKELQEYSDLYNSPAAQKIIQSAQRGSEDYDKKYNTPLPTAPQVIPPVTSTSPTNILDNMGIKPTSPAAVPPPASPSATQAMVTGAMGTPPLPVPTTQASAPQPPQAPSTGGGLEALAKDPNAAVGPKKVGKLNDKFDGAKTTKYDPTTAAGGAEAQPPAVPPVAGSSPVAQPPGPMPSPAGPSNTSLPPAVPKIPMGSMKKPEDDKFHIPFAQMYGTGASIGGGVASSPAGGVAPTAGFVAQRSHQLLNPDLNSASSPGLPVGTNRSPRPEKSQKVT